MVQIRQFFLAALLCAAALPAQKFYPDDPLPSEPPPLPVAHANHRDINDYFDFFQSTFFPPEPLKTQILHHAPVPSEAVNTLGDVPDSAWFTNRIGSQRMSIEELVRGPGDSHAPATDKPWVVVSGKSEGVSPGLVIRDSEGRRYFMKFDPKSNPEMATATDVIGSKFFYDIGYNVPENHIVIFGRRQLTLDKDSTFRDQFNHKRPMTDRDVDEVLKKVPRDKEGKYRGMASLTVPGDLLGPFRNYGTRSDDPNDIVDHQNRRDLRGLYVFCAWLNRTDAKDLNSMDTLVEEDGVRYIKHYLIDFGDIMGSDSIAPKDVRRGHAWVFQWRPAIVEALSFGLFVPGWMLADYPDIPAIGHFDYKTFDPENWKSNYQNLAFELRTPGDTYWAAKKVMAFTDEDIRNIVLTGQYSDPRAVEWATKCLIERRNRIGRAFFNDVLPLDNFQVRNGGLVFEDLAVKYGFVPTRSYTVQWSEFDNDTSRKTPVSGSGFHIPRANARYLEAEIQGGNPRQKVQVYLHGDTIVGIDRTW